MNSDKSKLKILVVDDSSENRLMFTHFLQDVPVEIDEISTGYGAIEACRREEYDYIFLDMLMPGLDGIRVMDNIKAMNLTHAPVIYAFTAAASIHEMDQYSSKGFAGMVPKPFTRETLRMALKFAE